MIAHRFVPGHSRFHAEFVTEYGVSHERCTPNLRSFEAHRNLSQLP